MLSMDGRRWDASGDHSSRRDQNGRRSAARPEDSGVRSPPPHVTKTGSILGPVDPFAVRKFKAAAASSAQWKSFCTLSRVCRFQLDQPSTPTGRSDTSPTATATKAKSLAARRTSGGRRFVAVCHRGHCELHPTLAQKTARESGSPGVTSQHRRAGGRLVVLPARLIVLFACICLAPRHSIGAHPATQPWGALSPSPTALAAEPAVRDTDTGGGTCRRIPFGGDAASAGSVRAWARSLEEGVMASQAARRL